MDVIAVVNLVLRHDRAVERIALVLSVPSALKMTDRYVLLAKRSKKTKETMKTRERKIVEVECF